MGVIQEPGRLNQSKGSLQFGHIKQ